MAYFPEGMPAPSPNFDDREFWRHCDDRELRFQCCAACGNARHPPSPVCPKCRSLQAKWQAVQGEGKVFSFTVIHHASHEAVKPNLPYVVAVVTFDDLPGVRLVSNVTDIPPSAVHIGMRVKLWWDEISDGHCLPRFRASGPKNER